MSENETPKAPAPEAPKPAAAPPAKAEHAKPAVDLQPWEKEPTAPQWVDGAEDALVQSVRARCGEAIEAARSYAGEMTFKVARAAFREVCAVLKNEHAFTLLVDLCGVDFPKRSERFEVVAHLYSFAANRRVRVKTTTDEATAVPSLTPVYKAANWPEREAWDMYGIRFADHPDLTRILLWEGFNGHPLRKDFPIEGIDTGAAIYPEYYDERQGPIAGTGTGWKPKKPEAEKPAAAPAEPPAAS